MPNLKIHSKTGAIIGLLTAAMRNIGDQEKRYAGTPGARFNWQEFFLHCLTGAGAGTIGGVAPDVLEPAYHSHHRRICHSMTALAGMGYGLKQVSTQAEMNPYLKTAILAAGAGYISHLVMDAATPRSIPLLT